MLLPQGRLDRGKALPLDALKCKAAERDANLGTEIPHGFEKTKSPLLQEVFLAAIQEEVRPASNNDQRLQITDDAGTELVVFGFLVFKNPCDVKVVGFKIGGKEQPSSPAYIRDNFLKPVFLRVIRKCFESFVRVLLPGNGKQIAPLAETVFAVAGTVRLAAACIQDGILSSLFVFVHDGSLQK